MPLAPGLLSDKEGGTRTILDRQDREQLLDRFHRLRRDSAARWGRMAAPEMLAHLSDQMRHALGDVPVAPRHGPLRWPLIRQAIMYWLPWPRGRVQGPPEAFVTRPTHWEAGLAEIETLVERFVAEEHRTDWPEHAFFGRMSRGSWGRFCHRHFDYHLRQFGV